VFDRRGLDVVYVPGTTIDDSQSISVGQVLDAHGRSYFSMSQMMNLVQLMKNGEVTSDDVIYFEDMFQPGIESLPYIMDQIPADMRPRVFVRCLAQAIDPDDFVHVWGMAQWMSTYEKMVNHFVSGVLATNEEMVAHMRIAGWTAPIYNISGLAFGKEEVLERVDGKVRPFEQRKMRVGFAARWDQEKQPGFFMDMIEAYLSRPPAARHEVRFAIFSGGSGKGAKVSLILGKHDKRALKFFSVLNVKREQGSTFVELDEKIKDSFLTGEIYIKRYRITLNKPTNKEYSSHSFILKVEKTPFLNLPLAKDNNIEQIYNQAILTIDSKIKELSTGVK
jgi:hypothetical protein